MTDQRADTPLAASDVWCPTCGHLLDPVTGEPAESAAAEPLDPLGVEIRDWRAAQPPTEPPGLDVAKGIASVRTGLEVTRDDATAHWEQNGVAMASAPVSWFDAAIGYLGALEERAAQPPRGSHDGG